MGKEIYTHAPYARGLPLLARRFVRIRSNGSLRVMGGGREEAETNPGLQPRPLPSLRLLFETGFQVLQHVRVGQPLLGNFAGQSLLGRGARKNGPDDLGAIHEVNRLNAPAEFLFNSIQKLRSLRVIPQVN